MIERQVFSEYFAMPFFKWVFRARPWPTIPGQQNNACCKYYKKTLWSVCVCEVDRMLLKINVLRKKVLVRQNI